MGSSIRLDQLLVQKGLAESREKAQRLIRAGAVRHDNTIYSKPGMNVAVDTPVTVDTPPRYVSRGGEKLEAALAYFSVPVEGRTVLDIGASTGGFTDCVLQHGAGYVYAVDVGKGQLHWRLRNDPRVESREGVNARDLLPSDFKSPPDMLVADVSFISLTKVLPAADAVLQAGSVAVTLIKPQFEAGREQVGKGGVIRDPGVHDEVIKRVCLFGQESLAWTCVGVIPSPLKGPAGNIEFLAYWSKP